MNVNSSVKMLIPTSTGVDTAQPQGFNAGLTEQKSADCAEFAEYAGFASCLQNQFAQMSEAASTEAQFHGEEGSSEAEATKIHAKHTVSEVFKGEESDGASMLLEIPDCVAIVNFAEVPSFADAAAESQGLPITGVENIANDANNAVGEDGANQLSEVQGAAINNIARPEESGNEVTYNTVQVQAQEESLETPATKEGEIQLLPIGAGGTTQAKEVNVVSQTAHGEQGAAQITAEQAIALDENVASVQRATTPIDEMAVSGQFEAASEKAESVQVEAQQVKAEPLAQTNTQAGEFVVNAETVQAQVSQSDETLEVKGGAVSSLKTGQTEQIQEGQGAETVEVVEVKSVTAQVGEAIVAQVVKLVQIVQVAETAQVSKEANAEAVQNFEAVQNYEAKAEEQVQFGTSATLVQTEEFAKSLTTLTKQTSDGQATAHEASVESPQIITASQVAGAVVKANEVMQAQTAQTVQTLQISHVTQVTELKIILSPVHLGEVVIRLVSEGNKISLTIVTQTEHARGILAARESSLRVLVEYTGVTIDKYEVTSADAVKASYLDPREKDGEQNAPEQGEQGEESDENSDSEMSFAEVVELMQTMN